MELGYSPELIGTFIDPPSGWRYGFPRQFNPNPGEHLRDWLIRNGYPNNGPSLDLAERYSRFIFQESQPGI